MDFFPAVAGAACCQSGFFCEGVQELHKRLAAPPLYSAGAGHEEKDAAQEVPRRPLSIPVVIWQPDNSVALASAATTAAAVSTPPIGCSLAVEEAPDLKDGGSELSREGSSSGRSTPAGDLPTV